LAGAGGADDEVRPPAGPGHVDALGAQEVPVDLAGGGVLRAFLGGEGDADPYGLVFRQVGAAELDDVLAVDGRPDQHLQICLTTVGAFRGGGQPKAVGRQAQPGGQGVGRTGQVVALVEHHQAEPRPQVFHVQVSRIIGGDGDGLDVVVAAAQQADRFAERRPQPVVPLAHEIQRGRDHQGAPLAILEGQLGDQGLARAGRQHHDAPAAGLLPGRQRFPLVGPGLAPHHHRPLQLLVGPGLILVADPAPHQGPDHVGVGRGWRPVAGRPRIPGARRRQGHRIRRQPLDLQRPRPKSQLNHHGPT
jgi:hypothetical protein